MLPDSAGSTEGALSDPPSRVCDRLWHSLGRCFLPGFCADRYSIHWTYLLAELKESCHEPTSLGDFFRRDFGHGDGAGVLRNGVVSPEGGALRIRHVQYESAVLAGGGSGVPRCRKMARREGGIGRAGEVFAGGGVGRISKGCK